DNSDLKLKPGMTANVTFVYAEKRDALRVPNAAMRFKPPPEMLGSGATAPGGHRMRPGGAQSDQRQVWVVGDSPLAPPKPVNIKVGVSDGSQSEVVEGDLKEGEEVI